MSCLLRHTANPALGNGWSLVRLPPLGKPRPCLRSTRQPATGNAALACRHDGRAVAVAPSRTLRRPLMRPRTSPPHFSAHPHPKAATITRTGLAVRPNCSPRALNSDTSMTTLGTTTSTSLMQPSSSFSHVSAAPLPPSSNSRRRMVGGRAEGVANPPRQIRTCKASKGRGHGPNQLE
jgi:hypothetical protein